MSTFELKRKLLRLEALYDVGRALNTLRPEEELLEELMQQAISVLDATLGFVYSLDENLQPLNLFVAGVDRPVGVDEFVKEEPIRRALISRETVSVFVPTFLGKSGGACLVAPIISAEKLFGTIGVVGKEERGTSSATFADDDLRFLSSLAVIAGAAIDNTRNFHRLSLARETLEDENRTLRQRMLREFSDRLMIGESPKMQRVMELIARVADSHANVLVRGESGTGKEMVARLIHANSPRKDRPFVAINCAALPETLLESELFGIERGVATGVEGRAGKFELAHGGTVFLDEIGDIPQTLQAKLLRVIQEREIEKVGGRRKIAVDVRILAATHRDLERMIGTNDFRQDLYYRLRVVEIVLPPLRERKEDIPKLVKYFAAKYGRREGLKNVRLSPEAMQKLMRYSFPGNVRELENLVEGALAVAHGSQIEPGDLLLPATTIGASEDELTDDLPPLRALEQRYVARVLAYTKGNISHASRILGIDRKTLYRRKEELAQYTPYADN